MNFGTWLRLDEARAGAPAEPGLLQARADAIRAYPRGKSAMVLYAGTRADETLSAFVAARGAVDLARAADAGARFVRYGRSAAPERELGRLLAGFEERFGAAPIANAKDAATAATTANDGGHGGGSGDGTPATAGIPRG